MLSKCLNKIFVTKGETDVGKLEEGIVREKIIGFKLFEYHQLGWFSGVQYQILEKYLDD